MNPMPHPAATPANLPGLLRRLPLQYPSGYAAGLQEAWCPLQAKPPRVSRDALHAHMRGRNVDVRRYFYPLICGFPMYRRLSSAPSAKLQVATQVHALAQTKSCALA